MLTKINIQGFKSLWDVQVKLGHINVFVGANGSGKTNFLEAIGLLSAAAGGSVNKSHGEVDDQDLMRRGVRPGTSSLYLSSFDDLGNAESIALNATWTAPAYESEYLFEFDKLSLAQQPPWSYRKEYKFDGQEFDGVMLDSFLSRMPDYAVFVPNTATLRGEIPDITQRRPIGLAGGQLAEAVGGLLDAGELLDDEQGHFFTLELDDLLELLDWVARIDVVPPSREIVAPSVPTLRSIIRFTDRHMKEGRNQLPAYAASEGALYVLFVLVLALHPESPSLFAIDNFDQSMHPRLARATARLFCEQMLQTHPPRQALLTTHNPLVLDGLDLRDDRIRLFAVERDSHGATRVHRVQVSDEVVQATQEGLSLSNLWVMGRLGGVPDLF